MKQRIKMSRVAVFNRITKNVEVDCKLKCYIENQIIPLVLWMLQVGLWRKSEKISAVASRVKHILSLTVCTPPDLHVFRGASGGTSHKENMQTLRRSLFFCGCLSCQWNHSYIYYFTSGIGGNKIRAVNDHPVCRWWDAFYQCHLSLLNHKTCMTRTTNNTNKPKKYENTTLSYLLLLNQLLHVEKIKKG